MTNGYLANISRSNGLCVRITIGINVLAFSRMWLLVRVTSFRRRRRRRCFRCCCHQRRRRWPSSRFTIHNRSGKVGIWLN